MAASEPAPTRRYAIQWRLKKKESCSLIDAEDEVKAKAMVLKKTPKAEILALIDLTRLEEEKKKEAEAKVAKEAEEAKAKEASQPKVPPKKRSLGEMIEAILAWFDPEPWEKYKKFVWIIAAVACVGMATFQEGILGYVSAGVLVMALLIQLLDIVVIVVRFSFLLVIGGVLWKLYTYFFG